MRIELKEPRRLFNTVVANQKGIRAELKDVADGIADKAKGLHTEHRSDDNVHSRISVSRGKLDAFVNLDDPGGEAGVIEWKVRTLHRAAGLM